VSRPLTLLTFKGLIVIVKGKSPKLVKLFGIGIRVILKRDLVNFKKVKKDEIRKLRGPYISRYFILET